jgi:photosystem II stability/assembly factor-like uncharacterized protein
MPFTHKLGLILAVLGMVLLEGCTFSLAPASPEVAAISGDFSSLGRWEVIRRIDYSKIPAINLKGDIGPAYLVYVVTLAGFHTESFGITAGADDDVRYTTDGGQSWTKAGNALFCRHGLEIVDEKVAWHCGNGGVRVSIDGAKTWRTVASFDCSNMSFLDAQTGWTASTYILRTTSDGGARWATMALPPDMKGIAAIALRTASGGYILDTDGNLFVTTDGGGSWNVHSLGLKPGEKMLSSVGSPLAAMRFLDAQHGMAVFDLEDKTVWFAITADGGQSWQRAEIPELRDRAQYDHLFLAHNGNLLTATNDVDNGTKANSVVFRYRQL